MCFEKKVLGESNYPRKITQKEKKGVHMHAIGIDIGTTNICLVVIDLQKEILQKKITFANPFIQTSNAWERIQEPQYIISQVKDALDTLIGEYTEIVSIGITGQMHGIVYLNQKGEAISPLYTWQDQRGEKLLGEDATLKEYVETECDGSLASGYGLATHLFNKKYQLVPKDARKICTISDYVAYVLVQKKWDVMHASNAASLGLFDVQKFCFYDTVLDKLDIDKELLPEVVNRMEMVGEYRGIPVAVTIGDNQASFAGSVKNVDSEILINIGTSAQISVLSDQFYKINKSIDVRPYLDGRYLLVGASLCGGCSYQLLEEFFRGYLVAAGYEGKSQFDTMNRLAAQFADFENKLNVSTLFSGTRDDGTMRGSIGNIDLNNFTPGHMIYGFLEGIVRELFDMYQSMEKVSKKHASGLVASGNGIRKNAVMQKIAKEFFGLDLTIPVYEEEAAAGAALVSAECSATV